MKIYIREMAGGAKFNRYHLLVLSWCVVILILDGYELAVFGAAMPSIMADLDIDAASAGIVAGAGLFGTMLGAIFLGAIADRIGRPKMIALCVTLFSVFTASATLTTEPIGFSVTRFIAGLGIGGVLPVVTAQMAEFAPENLRTRLVTLVFSGYAVGGIIVAVVAKQYIESHGWQAVFYAAGLPVFLVPLILKTMPESMEFLINQKQQGKLHSIVKRLVPDSQIASESEFVLAGSDTGKQATISALFEGGRGFSTVMIWIAFMTGLFMVYGLNSWLTKLMSLSGHSLGSALNFVLVFNIGAMIGAVGGGWLGDKLNIKYVLFSFYTVGAIALIAMAYTTHVELLFVVVFIVGASTLGTQLLAYAYAGDFYPSAIRSTGVGFASGVGRIGAIVAPVLIGGLVAMNLPLEQNFIAIALAGVIGALAVLMIDQTLASSSRKGDVSADLPA